MKDRLKIRLEDEEAGTVYEEWELEVWWNASVAPTTFSEIFINLILFANNMAKSTHDKIAKAAEARDKAIKEDAKKGMCAPCGEPSEDCMCDVFLDFVACE